MNRTTTSRDVALLLERLILAAVFVFHGSQKMLGAFGGYGLQGTADWMATVGIPLPLLSATLAASAELFGGIALALGAGTRLAVVPLTVTMLVATAVHSGGGFAVTSGGVEYTLVLTTVLLALGLSGAGRYSVDALLRDRLPAGSSERAWALALG
jgi:putative oxidoreductase